MGHPSNTRSESTTVGWRRPSVSALEARLARFLSLPDSRFLRTVPRAIAFWSAIILPFLHVPLLVAGLSSRAELAAFGFLVGLNLLTLRVGYSYRPGPADDG